MLLLLRLSMFSLFAIKFGLTQSFSQALSDVQIIPNDCSPEDTVKSKSPFAYSFFKAVTSNPRLMQIFDVNGSPNDLLDSLYSTFQQIGKHRISTIAKSLTLLAETAWYRITTIENIVAITNAFHHIFKENVVVTPKLADSLVTQFVDTLKNALDAEIPGPNAHIKVFVNGIFSYLSEVHAVRPNKLHDFVSQLAGQYYDIIHAKCRPLYANEITVAKHPF